MMDTMSYLIAVLGVDESAKIMRLASDRMTSEGKDGASATEWITVIISIAEQLHPDLYDKGNDARPN